MQRSEARRLRRTNRYREARAAFLAANPLCAACHADGAITPATELDHIEPIHRGGDFWCRDNWQGLCRPCHERKTASENMKPRSPEQLAWDRHLEGLTA